jgi:hypothetical protein
VAGVPLADAWRGLSATDRLDAVRQIGTALATLHAHQFPAAVTTALGVPRPADGAPLADLLGADLNPLPATRAWALVEHARRRPGLDPVLVDAVERRLRELAPIDPLDRPAAPGYGCVHGDAHPRNALWRDGRVVALLDFEWVRLGPADLELEPYLRPDLGGVEPDPDERRAILGALAQGHPAAFAAADLVRRVWLYQLGYWLRQLLLYPQFSHERLRRYVAGPEHVRRLLPAAQ